MILDIFCPIFKGTCIGKQCALNDEINHGTELTLSEQKGNCLVTRAMFSISTREV